MFNLKEKAKKVLASEFVQGVVTVGAAIAVATVFYATTNILSVKITELALGKGKEEAPQLEEGTIEEA